MRDFSSVYALVSNHSMRKLPQLKPPSGIGITRTTVTDQVSIAKTVTGRLGQTHRFLHNLREGVGT
jgi:hypothetical protein